MVSLRYCNVILNIFNKELFIFKIQAKEATTPPQKMSLRFLSLPLVNQKKGNLEIM